MFNIKKNWHNQVSSNIWTTHFCLKPFFLASISPSTHFSVLLSLGISVRPSLFLWIQWRHWLLFSLSPDHSGAKINHPLSSSESLLKFLTLFVIFILNYAHPYVTFFSIFLYTQSGKMGWHARTHYSFDTFL